MNRYQFPKIGLHNHPDGGFRPATLYELAEKYGIEPEAQTIGEYINQLRVLPGGYQGTDPIKAYGAAEQLTPHQKQEEFPLLLFFCNIRFTFRFRTQSDHSAD